ncbi:MAG: ROK family protein [Planctomycetes bacterium]|nr:ROK family protein [Planctomycetota bacterium]
MKYIGIEIGGTKLQLGVGAGDGVLAGLWRGPVDVAAGPEGIRRQIVAAVPELLQRAGIDRGELKGAGIGFGGPVDDATCTVIKSHQVEGWDDFPLADWVSDLIGLPAVLGNDADVAGLAEALFGAGKGLSPIFYITIGSGIGGGLIINGEIYRGVGRGAAEIGHLQFTTYWLKDSQTIYNSPTDTLEQLASGWGIAETAKRCIRDERPIRSLLYSRAEDDKRPLTANDVAAAARQGDAVAESILNTSIGYLADAICHVIALLCPRRIVLGGGVSLMGEKLLFDPLRRLVAERVFGSFAGLTDIVPAALGEEVVVHGALALARRHSQK